MKKSEYNVIFLSMLSSLIVTIATIYGNNLSMDREREFDIRKEANYNLIKVTYNFSNYWYIRWDSLLPLSYDKDRGEVAGYNEMGELNLSLLDSFISNDSLLSEEHKEIQFQLIYQDWQQIEKLKKQFYILTLHDRMYNSSTIKEKLKSIDSGFNQIIPNMIMNGGHHTRSMCIEYNELMPEKFNNLYYQIENI